MTSKYRFSPTAKSFYVVGVHQNIPQDAFYVTSDQYHAMVTDRPPQMSIAVDESGAPTLFDHTVLNIRAITALIKVERNRRQLEGGVKVGEHWFLSNECAISEYNSFISASFGVDQNMVLRRGWRTLDGGEVDMTPSLARQILVAVIAQRCAIDDAAQAHIATMEASPNQSKYNFSGDWPKVYDDVVVQETVL